MGEGTRSVAMSDGSMPCRETESSQELGAREPPESSWSKVNRKARPRCCPDRAGRSTPPSSWVPAAWNTHW